MNSVRMKALIKMIGSFEIAKRREINCL